MVEVFVYVVQVCVEGVCVGFVQVVYGEWLLWYVGQYVLLCVVFDDCVQYWMVCDVCVLCGFEVYVVEILWFVVFDVQVVCVVVEFE